MSWAINESAFGSSKIAHDKANLWGWNAVDGDAYNSATDWSNGTPMNADGAMTGLQHVCQKMYENVTDPSNFRYQKAVGAGYEPDSLAGVGTWYASDPNWGNNAIVWMKEIFTDFISQYCVSGGDILEVAAECWAWVVENNPTYGGCSIPPSSTIDCSGFVTWVLYEMGYTEFSYQWNTQMFIDNQEEIKSKYGWEIIPISQGQDISDIVQPGDIIDRSTGSGGSGHMNIAVSCENGTLIAYDCGSQKNWTERTDGGPIDRSYFLTSDGYEKPGKPGIIIRGVSKP